jgi:protein TonB
VAVLIYSPDLVLPWAIASDNDQRFKRILRNLLIGFLLFAMIIPFLPVEEITREKQEALPPQLARVIMEKKELAKPIPVPPKPKPVKKEKPKEKEKEKEKPKEKVKPKPEPKKKEAIKEAQKKAAVSGVLAFQDDLADMRDSLDMDSLANTDVTRNNAQAAKVERSIITSGAVASGSSGIKTSALSRDTGGQALSARETTRVESPVNASAQSEVAGSSASMGGRSDQSIRRVMDKNKGAIFSIYNRALRKDPTLQGKLVFEMVIEPSGQVSEVKLLSSELGDEALTRKILSRIRLIRFEAADVITTRVNYSFDFLPY